MIVGLTGGIGAGKSTASKIFASLGVPIISADEISHELITTNKSIFNNIITHFGKEYLTLNNTIDRKKLRQRIFKAPIDKAWLENLLHPLIKQEIKFRTKTINYPYCILEIPLLIEAGMRDCVDRILTITCQEQLKIDRSMLRDDSSKEIIEAILSSQLPDQERLSLSDDSLDNSGDINSLEQKVLQQHQNYLQLAASKN